MGLVSRVVADDERCSTRRSTSPRRCAGFSPYGLAMTKDIIWANLENASLEAAIEIEDRNQLMLGFTENLPEAIRGVRTRAPARLHRRTAARPVLLTRPKSARAAGPIAEV